MTLNLKDHRNHPTMVRDTDGLAIEAFAPKTESGFTAQSTAVADVQSLEIDIKRKTRLIRVATRAAPGVDVAAIVKFEDNESNLTSVPNSAMLIPANSVEYFKFEGFSHVVFKSTASANITVQVSIMN